MNDHLKNVLAMFIFGTIGIFRRYLPLPSSFVAMMRGAIGMVFLLTGMCIGRKRLDRRAIRASLPYLCISGACLGINWILLFEAYNYTSVATATLCYYLAPMFIILISPVLLKERITARKLGCVGVALIGMVCVSGVVETGLASVAELRGVLLGLAAAVFYACVVLMNKVTPHVPANDRTIVQLGVSSLVLLPYVLLTEELPAIRFTTASACMLAVVGVVHTGVAYALYFSSLRSLKAQTAAILSYIDPVVAILLSALLLRERMSLLGGVGAVLVLGSAIVSELPERHTRQNPTDKHA